MHFCIYFSKLCGPLWTIRRYDLVAWTKEDSGAWVQKRKIGLCCFLTCDKILLCGKQMCSFGHLFQTCAGTCTILGAIIYPTEKNGVWATDLKKTNR